MKLSRYPNLPADKLAKYLATTETPQQLANRLDQQTHNPIILENKYQSWKLKYADWTNPNENHTAHTQFGNDLRDHPEWFHTDPQTGITWTHGARWYHHYPNTTQTPHGPAIPGIIHQINNDGYHGPEFHHNPHTLTLGCSMTAGIGLPHNYVWPNIYAHITGHTVNNIAITGTSIAQQVQSALIHIEKYGTPKEICVLTPPLDRYWGPWTTNELGWTYTGNIHYDYNIKSHIQPGTTKPYTHRNIDNTKNTLGLDQALTSNIQAIENLQQTAKILGTTLKISSWENACWTTLNTLPHINNTPLPHWRTRDHTNIDQHRYEPNEHDEWGVPHPLAPQGSRKNCGCQLTPQNQNQNNMWDTALDHPRPHMGLHLQLHLTEHFLTKPITNHHLNDLHPFWHNTNLQQHIK